MNYIDNVNTGSGKITEVIGKLTGSVTSQPPRLTLRACEGEEGMLEREFRNGPKDTICTPLERLVEGRGPALCLSVVVEGVARVPIPSSSKWIRVGHSGTIIQMEGAPVTSRLEDVAGSIVVFPVVIIVVIVVVSVIIVVVVVTKRVRSFATLFDDGKVEGDNDCNGGDDNGCDDRTNYDLTFRFARRSISVTFLLEVSAAPARGDGPGDKVGIVRVVLIWDGRITARVTVYKRVQRIDGGRVVVAVYRGRDSEGGSERSPSTFNCSMTEEPWSRDGVLSEIFGVELVLVEWRVLEVVRRRRGVVSVTPDLVDWRVILMPFASVNWVVRRVLLRSHLNWSVKSEDKVVVSLREMRETDGEVRK